MGIDLGKRAVNVAMDSLALALALALALEIEQATLASNPDNFGADNKATTTGTGKWDNPASTPITDVEAAKDQVRTTCGVEPNRMVINNAGFRALKNHPTIIDRFKYTTIESITARMLAGLFDLEEVAVGKATYVDSDANDATFTEAWGNIACLAYVPGQDPVFHPE